MADAEFGRPVLDQYPPPLHAPPNIGEFDLHQDAAGRQTSEFDMADVPHEFARIEFAARELAAQVALTPMTGHLDERRQILANTGGMIFPAASAGGRLHLDHSLIA